MTGRPCAAALAVHLGYSFSAALTSELDRIKTEKFYEERVFFVRNLGFVKPSDARRISFEDALRFERIHEETYRRFGFDLVCIEPGNLLDRVSQIKKSVVCWEASAKVP
jgi:predicted ATPase